MTDQNPEPDSPFTAILAGDAEGTIIARDENQRFALIASLEPEAAAHWLAMPYEAGQRTEELQAADRERFLSLIEWAIAQAQAHAAEYPELANGFTIKLHFGAYETVPHAKVHVLSTE
jgi:histidine triad (HIT) family protein